MKTNTAILRLLVILVLFSCNNNIDMKFDYYKEDYKRVVTCLDSNYESIFSSSNKNSVDVYNSDKASNQLCGNLLYILGKRSVNIIIYYSDSTTFFYSKPTKGVMSKQIIFVYARNRNSLETKLSSDIKMKNVKGDGWYELERVISLAN